MVSDAGLAGVPRAQPVAAESNDGGLFGVLALGLGLGAAVGMRRLRGKRTAEERKLALAKLDAAHAGVQAEYETLQVRNQEAVQSVVRLRSRLRRRRMRWEAARARWMREVYGGGGRM